MEISPEIKMLSPWVPGKPIEETKREFGIKTVIKLASNENALGPSPKVVAALKKALKSIHLYPDGATFELKNTYCEIFGFAANQVSFGNGSDELINNLIRVYCKPGDRIVMSQYGFLPYKIAAQAHRLGTDEVPVTADFNYDVDALINFINTKWTKDHKIIFYANPNNPTGSYINTKDADRLIRAIQNRKDLILVIDEAYLEFARSSDYAKFEKYLKTTPNLLLLRTLSKAYALAGLRLGILIGAPETIDYVNRVRLPFNINSLAQVAAVTAMKDKTHLKKSQKLAWEGLDYFYEVFEQMKIKFYPSEGNFLLIDVAREAGGVYQELLKRGIIVRPLKPYGLDSYLRISVGTKAENRQFIKVLAAVLGKH
jgi:histidinol-phosphate aminotransferase